MNEDQWWELTAPYLARVFLFALIVFMVAQCGCAGAEPTRVGRNSSCDLALTLDASWGLPGWTVLECEKRSGIDCRHREIQVAWDAEFGTFERLTAQARECK